MKKLIARGGVVEMAAACRRSSGNPIERAIAFLYNTCTSVYGFQGVVGQQRLLGDMPTPAEELFGSPEVFSSSLSFLLLFGSGLNGRLMETLRNFIAESHQDGIFRFFTAGPLFDQFPPDVDCTAMGGIALRLSGKCSEATLVSAARAIVENVNGDGIIQVYLPPRDEREDRVDPVACFNTLAFLYLMGVDPARFRRTEDYLYGIVGNDRAFEQIEREGTRYYPSVDVLLLLSANAVTIGRHISDKGGASFKNAQAFRDRFGEVLLRRLNQREGQPSEYVSDYAARIVAARLMGKQNESDKEALIKRQPTSGQWPSEAVFRCGRNAYYFGSAQLTTVLAVAALDFGRDDVLVEEFLSARRAITYPFEGHSGANLAYAKNVNGELLSWIERYHLFSDSTRPRYAAMLADYACHCAVENATQVDLLLAAKFLAVFYWINEKLASEPNQDLSWLDRVQLVLLGAPSSGDHFENAVADFRVELGMRGQTAQVVIEFQNLLREVKRECSWATGKKPSTLKEYLDNRRVTIFVRAWIRVWETLGLVIPTNCSGVSDAAVDIILAENDARSIRRDGNDKASYITTVMKERGVSFAKAGIDLMRFLDQATEKFRSFSESTRTEEGARYLNFLRTCIVGNHQVMNMHPERYDQ